MNAEKIQRLTAELSTTADYVLFCGIPMGLGAALLAIRDKRLYRQDYDTFEAYCQQRWGMQRNYANKLIAAAVVIENLGTKVPILPTSERQARPLTVLPAEVQSVVWEQVLDTAPNGKITAAHVQAVVSEVIE